MNTSKYVATPEQWGLHVKEYEAMSSGARTGAIVTRLLAAANAASPFSKATGILDDGCGSGNATFVLIEEYGSSISPTARLVASDYSSGMIASVEALKKDPSLVSNPSWQRLETHVLNAADILAGGQSAPIKPASLSHILPNLVLMAVADYKAALRSAYDALEDTGVLAFSTWLNMPWIDCWSYARPVAPDQGRLEV
jgi:SAM-dependent methyltransferase